MSISSRNLGKFTSPKNASFRGRPGSLSMFAASYDMLLLLLLLLLEMSAALRLSYVWDERGRCVRAEAASHGNRRQGTVWVGLLLLLLLLFPAPPLLAAASSWCRTSRSSVRSSVHICRDVRRRA